MEHERLFARARFDFFGDSEDGDLRFSKGDLVQILSGDESAGWWQGHVVNHPNTRAAGSLDDGGAGPALGGARRQNGRFPSNHVDLARAATALYDFRGDSNEDLVSLN